jgi:hypothetical protein
MKKITIGIVTVFTLLPAISFTASNSTTKNEVAIPCYNGGFSFGLAGYQVPTPKPCPQQVYGQRDVASGQNRNQPDYR